MLVFPFGSKFQAISSQAFRSYGYRLVVPKWKTNGKINHTKQMGQCYRNHWHQDGESLVGNAVLGCPKWFSIVRNQVGILAPWLNLIYRVDMGGL